jgi:hypothetical protein
MPVKLISESPAAVYQAPAYDQPNRTVTVANTDTVNPVYYSDGPGTIDAQSAFIPPLGSEEFDGQDDIWMSTLNSNINVNIQLKIGSRSFYGGAVSIQGNVTATVDGDVTITGQTLALDVSGATVTIEPVNGFILPGENNTLTQDLNTHVVPDQGTFGYPLVNVQDYTSIDLTIGAISSAQAVNNAAITYQLSLEWFDDSAGLNLVYSETVFGYVAKANNAAPLPMTGSCPVHGQYLRIACTNPGTVSNVSFNDLTVTGSFRAVPHSKWFSYASASNVAINGVTLTDLLYPGQVAGEGGLAGAFPYLNLGSIPGTNPGAGLHAYLLPLFAGPVFINYQVSGAGLGNAATLVDLSYVTSGNLAAGTGQPGSIWTGAAALNSAFQGIVNFPRSPVALVLNYAAGTDVLFSAVGQEV